MLRIFRCSVAGRVAAVLIRAGDRWPTLVVWGTPIDTASWTRAAHTTCPARFVLATRGQVRNPRVLELRVALVVGRLACGAVTWTEQACAEFRSMRTVGVHRYNVEDTVLGK